MARLEHVAGNTDCLFLKGNCIPVYRLTEGEWVLMDSGAPSDREELLAYLGENRIKVRAVLTSHTHADHVGNHGLLKERFGCECIMTAFDAGAVHDPVSLKAIFYSCTEPEIRHYYGNMVCSGDRILGGPGKIQVCGREFQAVSLPGHAACQTGYITNDGVVYLGDCLLGPDEVRRQKLVYMLNWRTALETMREAEVFDGRPCILSHYGVYRDIKHVTEANIQAFEAALAVVRAAAGAEFSLDEMVKRTVDSMGIAVNSLPKARLMERVVRSMVEYMTETGELRIRMKDGLIVYIRP